MTDLASRSPLPASPVAITSSGQRLNLLVAPTAHILAADIAEHLARINRWSGAAPFSVATHSCYVAGEMARADGPLAAVYGLLHDAHEYVLGDITESAVSALAHHEPRIRHAIEALKQSLDRTIHDAFGLDWPRPDTIERVLNFAHDRVVMSEFRDLLHRCDDHLRAYAARGVKPLEARLRTVASWADAADRWLSDLNKYSALSGLGRIAI